MGMLFFNELLCVKEFRFNKYTKQYLHWPSDYSKHALYVSSVYDHIKCINALRIWTNLLFLQSEILPMRHLDYGHALQSITWILSKFFCLKTASPQVLLQSGVKWV